MHRILLLSSYCLILSLCAAETQLAKAPALLDFQLKTLAGEDTSMAAYYGRPILVVNVASKCGLTRQYKSLQALHEKYEKQGLAVVGFPCNDFGKQEPGTADEIQSFCEENFGVTFDLMEKISVAPGKRHPFYAKLIKDAGGPDKIQWNFEKFLIDRNGKVAKRFAPRTKPDDKTLIAAVEKSLATPAPAPLAYATYLGRRVAHTMHWKGATWLIRTEREREEATSTMLKELNLKPGMVVADVGCGNGYHAIPMAKTVGKEGKIIGSDIQPEMLVMLKKRAAEAGVSNIETVKGTLTTPKLPSDAVDRILLVDAYHEFSHPPQMLKAMRDALKPDGQIILVEFRSEDKSVPIKADHKMSKAQVIKELQANGFKLTRSYDKLPWQHMLFFGKAE